MKKYVLFTLFVMSFMVRADHTTGNVDQSLNAIDVNIENVRRNVFSLPPHAKYRVKERLLSARQEINRAIRDLESAPVPVPVAGWYQVDRLECSSFCRSIGRSVGVSREGAQCVSGENRAASAIGKINFVNGCWPNCSGEAVSQAVSIGQFCYKPGQKQDNDRTDLTVGCFCR